MNAWDPITEEAVLQALELILNPTNYPMMIMCNLGRHRTGNFFFFLLQIEKFKNKNDIRHDCRMFEKVTEMEFDIYF